MNRETFQHTDMQRITPPNPSFQSSRSLAKKKETEKMKEGEGRDGRQQQNKAL